MRLTCIGGCVDGILTNADPPGDTCRHTQNNKHQIRFVNAKIIGPPASNTTYPWSQHHLRKHWIFCIARAQLACTAHTESIDPAPCWHKSQRMSLPAWYLCARGAHQLHHNSGQYFIIHSAMSQLAKCTQSTREHAAVHCKEAGEIIAARNIPYTNITQCLQFRWILAISLVVDAQLAEEILSEAEYCARSAMYHIINEQTLNRLWDMRIKQSLTWTTRNYVIHRRQSMQLEYQQLSWPALVLPHFHRNILNLIHHNYCFPMRTDHRLKWR